MDSWELVDGMWQRCFIVSQFYGVDPQKDQDLFKKHLLFELLYVFGIIEYIRGYDGAYYNIYIKERKR